VRAPRRSLAVRPAPYRLEALRAVHRLVTARLEGDLGLLATRRARRREHLAARPVEAAATAAAVATAAAEAIASATAVAAATTTAATRLAGSAALRASARLVHQSARLIELLLAARKYELTATVTTGNRLVLKQRVALLVQEILCRRCLHQGLRVSGLGPRDTRAIIAACKVPGRACGCGHTSSSPY
jgi:hypothetical protein